MITLGIETSGRAGSIALWRDELCLEERPLEDAGRRHAQTLVSGIDRLLRDYALRPHDCSGVAVSIGPGSFTGLRVGVVCAKTFAYAVGCPLSAVDTLLCIAENSPEDVEDVSVIADAQRGELYVGRYRRRAGGAFERLQEIAIVSGESWCRNRSQGDVVTGPAVEKYEPHLAGRARLLPPEARLPRAAVVARLGARRISEGKAADLWTLEPVYIRRSAAEEKWDAAHPNAP